MNIEYKIVKTLKKMPLSLQKELLHYAEYLETKYMQDNSDIIDDFTQAWQEAMTGKTIQVSELWEDFEDE